MTLLRTLAPWIALTLIGLAVPSAASAHEGREAMAQELGLTDAQRTQVEEIEFQARTGRIALEAQLETARAQLHHALTAATLDDAALAKAMDAANAAQAAIRKSRVDQVVALRKVLTADQWARAAEMMAQRGERDDDQEGPDGGERGEHPRGEIPSGAHCKDCDEHGQMADGAHCKDCDEHGQMADGAHCKDCDGDEHEEAPHPDCDGSHCKDCDERAEHDDHDHDRDDDRGHDDHDRDDERDDRSDDHARHRGHGPVEGPNAPPPPDDGPTDDDSPRDQADPDDDDRDYNRWGDN